MWTESASRAGGAPSAGSATPTRRGVVIGAERDRLRGSFGLLLRRERRAAGLSQAALAERAKVALCTVRRLENGRQRPSEGMCWRLAKGLRVGLDDRAVVGLDVRLRAAAGESLRTFSTRAHRRRERLAAELIADGLPISGADDFGLYTLSLLLATS
jgi:transcriptional regulator with XRE-family HTH domain